MECHIYITIVSTQASLGAIHFARLTVLLQHGRTTQSATLVLETV